MKILNMLKNLKTIYKIIIICFIIIIAMILVPIIWYNSSINPVSTKSEKVDIQIEIGSSSDSIASILENSGLIKSKLAFKIYIKLNNITDFQAGNYTLNKNMDLDTITKALQTGKVAKEQISITFIEGKNIKWIANVIENNTNNTQEDVFELLKDETYINSLINEYWFITDEIKNKDIYYPLEGYLFPDTYFFDGRDTSVQEIFKVMLEKMDEVLSDFDLSTNKYTIHELLTLASVVELEGLDVSSRKDIAGVFYNRLNSNMSLGSDVTTYYAYKIEVGQRDLTTKELYTYNPYNTRGPEMFGKLPVGPICSPSLSAIDATINPNKNKYFYFVADKNGKVYFSKTLGEQENTINKLKNEDLWYEY